MSKTFSLLACLLFMTACAGDPPPGDDDDDPDVDASIGATCTGAVYDSCTDTTNSSDCMEGMMCHPFDQAGITVCVPACSESMPCPQQDGAEIRCNNMGRCRPDVANACTLP
jgi:hypothetical protein